MNSTMKAALAALDERRAEHHASFADLSEMREAQSMKVEIVSLTDVTEPEVA